MRIEIQTGISGPGKISDRWRGGEGLIGDCGETKVEEKGEKRRDRDRVEVQQQLSRLDMDCAEVGIGMNNKARGSCSGREEKGECRCRVRMLRRKR